MPNLDDVSLKIGALEAKNEAVLAHIKTVLIKQDQLLDRVNQINGSVRDAHLKIKYNEEVLKEKLEESVTKKQALLGIIGLGSLAGAGASGALKIITSLFGH